MPKPTTVLTSTPRHLTFVKDAGRVDFWNDSGFSISEGEEVSRGCVLGRPHCEVCNDDSGSLYMSWGSGKGVYESKLAPGQGDIGAFVRVFYDNTDFQVYAADSPGRRPMIAIPQADAAHGVTQPYAAALDNEPCIWVVDYVVSKADAIGALYVGDGIGIAALETSDDPAN